MWLSNISCQHDEGKSCRGPGKGFGLASPQPTKRGREETETETRELGKRLEVGAGVSKLSEERLGHDDKKNG